MNTGAGRRECLVSSPGFLRDLSEDLAIEDRTFELPPRRLPAHCYFLFQRAPPLTCSTTIPRALSSARIASDSLNLRAFRADSICSSFLLICSSLSAAV